MVRIKLKIHANSSQEKIKRLDGKNYEVWLKEKPVDNKANLKLIKMFKKIFKKDIKIVSGFSSKSKVIEIL